MRATITAAILALGLTSCVGIVKDSIRRDAAIYTRCDKTRIRVIEQNGHTAYIDACGRPYICESTTSVEDQITGLGHWSCRSVRR